MIKNFRLAPATIFIYDCSRFLLMLAYLNNFQRSGLELNYLNFPLTMYIAPNALFPLMSLFLFIRFDSSRAYIPLYITGKILSLLCMAIWLFFVFQRMSDIFQIIWATFFIIGDLGAVIGVALFPFQANAEKRNLMALGEE